MEKCDIIASNALEQFSAKFGKQLNEIDIDARVPNGQINNDLTGESQLNNRQRLLQILLLEQM